MLKIKCLNFNLKVLDVQGVITYQCAGPSL